MAKRLLTFLSENWPGIVLLMVVLLFACFLIGYFGNALFGYKFELSAIWSGVAALASGSLALAAKYYTASKFNSFQGQEPYKQGGETYATGNPGTTSSTGRSGAE